jgi:oxygen-independent coproporphyrinogen-3 oxidase
MSISPPFSLYIHIPFCTHRCAYCDFNTYAGQEQLIPAYVDALGKEIEFVGTSSRAEWNRSAGDCGVQAFFHVHSIFFGGGTPSLLTPDQFESIFAGINSSFVLTDDA